jgi:hypothetical protein
VVRVTRSLVSCVCFVDRCLSFCHFSVGHCAVCSSSIYRFWLPLWCLQTLICITCLMRDIVVSTFIFRCWILPTKSTQSGKPNILKQFPTVVSYLDYPHNLFRTLTIPNSSFIPWLSLTVLSYLDYPHQFFRTLTITNSCFLPWLSPSVLSYLDYPQQLFPTLNILNVITEESQAPFNTATYSPAPMGKIELT